MAAFGRLLGGSWLQGTSGGRFEASWADLGASWEASWPRLGAFGGASLGASWGVLGRLGGILGLIS